MNAKPPAAGARDGARSVVPRPRAWKLGEAARRRLLATAASRAGTLTRAGSSGTVDVDAAIVQAIREETAAAIGRAGRRLQEAVAALAAFDRAAGRAVAVPDARADSARAFDHARLIDDATDALWACVVQREAMGLTDHRMLDALYQVPPLLWRRLGVTTAASGGYTAAT